MGNSTNPETTALGASKMIVVPTEDGDIIVRRLPLIDYAQLLRSFKKLPKEMGQFIDGNGEDDFKNSSTAEMIEKLLPLLEASWADFVAILAVPTNKDAEFIGQLDGGDTMEVLAAVLELNNYQKVMAAVKKLRARGITDKMPQVEQTPTEA